MDLLVPPFGQETNEPYSKTIRHLVSAEDILKSCQERLVDQVPKGEEEGPTETIFLGALLPVLLCEGTQKLMLYEGSLEP